MINNDKDLLHSRKLKVYFLLAQNNNNFSNKARMNNFDLKSINEQNCKNHFYIVAITPSIFKN